MQCIPQRLKMCYGYYSSVNSERIMIQIQRSTSSNESERQQWNCGTLPAHTQTHKANLFDATNFSLEPRGEELLSTALVSTCRCSRGSQWRLQPSPEATASPNAIWPNACDGSAPTALRLPSAPQMPAAAHLVSADAEDVADSWESGANTKRALRFLKKLHMAIKLQTIAQ